jgi:hypothetical protein
VQHQSGGISVGLIGCWKWTTASAIMEVGAAHIEFFAGTLKTNRQRFTDY